MTGRQEDKLSMWAATDAILMKHDRTWVQIPAFKQAVDTFRAIRFEIDPEAQTQMVNRKGITEHKSDDRHQLVALVGQMAMNIKAYAINKRDVEMETQFTYAPSYLDKIRDSLFPIVVNSVLNKALDLATDLLPFGVTSDSVQELADAAAYYVRTNASPRVAVVERSKATINIAAKMAEGLRQLEIMDNLLGNFNKENPDFVATFRSARMVINLGSHKKKVVIPKDAPPTPPTES